MEQLTKEQQESVYKELSAINDEIEKLRKKRKELNAKAGAMSVSNYTLKDRDGNEVKLYDLFGDNNFLIVIHNMGKGCSYCTMWADGMKDTFREVEKKAGFVLVSPDKPEVHKAFAESRGWGFRSYSSDGSEFTYDLGYEVRKDGKSYYWPGVSVLEKRADGSVVRVTKDFFGPGDFFCNVWHFYDLLPTEDITMNS
ncbi:MAG: DUF899 family protein [Ignavibacteria bacterium]|nr:DUF899 family protein [Ignavibacteria bacterium]